MRICTDVFLEFFYSGSEILRCFERRRPKRTKWKSTTIGRGGVRLNEVILFVESFHGGQIFLPAESRFDHR